MSKIEEHYASEILQQAKDFYHKIKSIYDSTGYSQSYQHSHIWEAVSWNIETMTNIINSDASAVDIIRKWQNIYIRSGKEPDQIREKAVDWYIAYLKQCGHDILELDSAFQESAVTNPAFCVSRAGRLLTPNFLRSVVLNLEIQKHCNISKSRPRIVELGGGYGDFARTFKLFRPSSVHVDIDIPETLYFAYLRVRLDFPHAKTCYVTDISQLKDGIQEFDFVYIPTIFAECILKDEFDIFYNTASLGEMANPVIRYWMDFVQNRLKVKYFFGLNRFLNTIDPPSSSLSNFSRNRLNENECSVLFDANWKILDWELEPPLARCPYAAETNTTRNLKIIAERLPQSPTNEYDRQLRSQQIAEDIMDEDWYRFIGREFHGTMRSNTLANDLTMSGTLFKLWESIRLHPNKTNLAMMIIYLDTLTKTDCPFEECFYYKNLFNDLLSDEKSDEKYEPVLKHALALSVSLDTFNVINLYPPFIRFILYNTLLKLYKLYVPIRRPYMRLRSQLLRWADSIPYLKNIKRSIAKRFYET